MPHILLIEDDNLLRPMLRATMEEMGHTVTEARNGKEGLLQFALVPVDVVLTDIIMPEKDGVETIIELRKQCPDLKIIAMSGGGRGTATDYLRVAKQLGAEHVLEKPFSRDELAAAINAS